MSALPLTPEDVRNKRFTPVRLREGYDMGEVDQFLDEVESQLEQLTTDNSDLQRQLEAAAGSAPLTSAAPEVPAETVEAAPEPEPARTSPTIGEAAGAATRLLELAARNADEVVVEARDEAERVLAEARANSERVESDSREKSGRLESAARARAEQLDTEITAKRSQLFGDLERDRDELTREVEQLQVFEREYRNRLRSYFTSQLAHLEGDEQASAPLPGPDEDPRPNRLQSLLGEEQNQG